MDAVGGGTWGREPQDRLRRPAKDPERQVLGLDRQPPELRDLVTSEEQGAARGFAVPLEHRYFASGSGRSWNLITLLVVPFAVSMWNGARVLTVDQMPRPFQPAAGSSMRPSIHFV